MQRNDDAAGVISLEDERGLNATDIVLYYGMTDALLRNIISQNFGIKLEKVLRIIAIKLLLPENHSAEAAAVPTEAFIPWSTLLSNPDIVVSLCNNMVARIVYFNPISQQPPQGYLATEGMGRPLTAPSSDKFGRSRNKSRAGNTSGKRKQRESNENTNPSYHKSTV